MTSDIGDTTTGTIFTNLIEVIVIALMIYAIFFNIDIGNGWFYSVVPFFFNTSMHSWSLLLLSTSFLLHWQILKHLYPIPRFLVASSIMVWYIYFSNMMWTTCSIIYRGTGFYPTVYLGFIFLTYWIYRMNQSRGFFKLSYNDYEILWVLLFIALQILGLGVMSLSGFWDAMTLSDLGIGGDPNVNLGWVIWKTSSFWMLSSLLYRSRLKAPLNMKMVKLW